MAESWKLEPNPTAIREGLIERKTALEITGSMTVTALVSSEADGVRLRRKNGPEEWAKWEDERVQRPQHVTNGSLSWEHRCSWERLRCAQDRLSASEDH